MLSALQERRLISWEWEAAYSDLRAEFITTADALKEQMAALELQINNERRAWSAEVARSRKDTFLWVFAAAAVGYAAGR